MRTSASGRAHRRGVRPRRRGRRRRPARRRPDRARRARRDGGRRVARCRRLDVPVYAVLGNHDHHANRVRRAHGDARGRGRRRARALVGARARSRTRRSASPGRRASSAASPGARCPTSASRCCARSTRRRARTSPRSTRALGRDRGLPAARRAPPLLADDEHARRRAGVDLDVPRHESPRRADPEASSPTSCCTGTRTRARSPARVGPVPVYNVAVHVMRRDFFVFELDTDAPDGHGARLEATV